MKAKYLLLVYAIIFSGNFFLNIYNNFNKNNFDAHLVYKLISFTFAVIFYYLISAAINKSLNLNSYSLSIAYFFISYFLFDHLFMFVIKDFFFDVTLIVVSLIWILVIYKKENRNHYFYLFSSFVFMRLYNQRFFEEISRQDSYIELNSDVTAQWLPSAQSIYEKGYYFAYSNNFIEGQGLLGTHMQALLHKLNFGTNTFQFIQTNSYLIVFFTVLVFIDLKISKSNKILIIIMFLSLVLNNSWLTYLIGNSLMLEGIVGFFISAFLINIDKFFNIDKKYVSIFFVSFGTLVLSKQFISLIVIIIMTLNLLRRNKNVLFCFIPLTADLLNKYFLKLDSSFITYSDGIDYFKIIKDLLLLENLHLNNVEKIVTNLFIDIPLTLLLLLYLVSNFIMLLKMKKINFNNHIFFYSGILNFLLIVVLYISYWQTIEIGSSYRYMVNFLSIYLVSIALNIQKLDSN
jgi:hypothetical protein